MLYYQPIVSVKTNKVVGVEALLRMEHPTHGMRPTSDFIREAEDTGYILEIGDWIIETALTQPALAGLEISINISMSQLLQPDFVESMLEHVQNSATDACRTNLEITEHVLMQNNQLSSVINTMTELKKHGIKFSLDDFGTGYSSLSYLKALDVDTIKIDKCFIDIHDDTYSRAIIKCLMTLAADLDYTVVAEGVETKEQLDFLKEIGCDLYQGFYVAEPMPVNDLVDFLKEHKGYEMT